MLAEQQGAESMNERANLASIAFALMVACVAAPSKAQAPVYAALDPRGTYPAVERVPLATRLPSLAGKRIYIVMSWPSGSGMDQVQRISPPPRTRTRQEGGDQEPQHAPFRSPELERNETGRDGYIYIGAASSSTTSYVQGAHLEQIGIPGGTVVFDQLAVRNHTGARRRAVAACVLLSR
jgi:hypothetical protein